MPAAATNETSVVATSAMLVEESNDTPAPREGEPTDYMLVLGDIIHANEPGKQKGHVQRDVRQKYEKGKYADYKSACLCDVENECNGQVSLHQYLYFKLQYKN